MLSAALQLLCIACAALPKMMKASTPKSEGVWTCVQAGTYTRCNHCNSSHKTPTRTRVAPWTVLRGGRGRSECGSRESALRVSATLSSRCGGMSASAEEAQEFTGCPGLVWVWSRATQRPRPSARGCWQSLIRCPSAPSPAVRGCRCGQHAAPQFREPDLIRWEPRWCMCLQ